MLAPAAGTMLSASDWFDGERGEQREGRSLETRGVKKLQKGYKVVKVNSVASQVPQKHKQLQGDFELF
jgi:hypothetical protein